jgi:hypothetical protein
MTDQFFPAAAMETLDGLDVGTTAKLDCGWPEGAGSGDCVA